MCLSSPSLQRLHLAYPGITDSGLMALAAQLPDLRHLQLSCRSPRLTGTGLEILARARSV